MRKLGRRAEIYRKPVLYHGAGIHPDWIAAQLYARGAEQGIKRRSGCVCLGDARHAAALAALFLLLWHHVFAGHWGLSGDGPVPGGHLGIYPQLSAYFCEIFRGGILSVDKGQYEAAKVLGYSKWQTTTKIVIPQMLKVCLPPVSNECITLVKDTALVTAIGVTEILYFARHR